MPKNETGFGDQVNYLTRMARQAERRRMPRRECELCVGLLYTQQGVREIREGKIWLHSISESGAMASSRTAELPEHFFIYFGDYQYFVGCTLVSQEQGVIRLAFIKEQPTEFVDILSRISDAFEFRGPVRLSLYGLPDHSAIGFSMSALHELDS